MALTIPQNSAELNPAESLVTLWPGNQDDRKPLMSPALKQAPPPSAEETLQAELDRVNDLLAGYDELVARRERLAAALAALEGKAIAPVAHRPASTARASRNRSGAQKSISDNEIIHAAVAHGGPISATEIREAIGLADEQSNALSVKLKRMVDAGQLRREWERRSSRYVVPA